MNEPQEPGQHRVSKLKEAVRSGLQTSLMLLGLTAFVAGIAIYLIVVILLIKWFGSFH